MHRGVSSSIFVVDLVLCVQYLAEELSAVQPVPRRVCKKHTHTHTHTHMNTRCPCCLNGTISSQTHRSIAQATKRGVRCCLSSAVIDAPFSANSSNTVRSFDKCTARMPKAFSFSTSHPACTKTRSGSRAWRKWILFYRHTHTHTHTFRRRETQAKAPVDAAACRGESPLESTMAWQLGAHERRSRAVST